MQNPESFVDYTQRKFGDNIYFLVQLGNPWYNFPFKKFNSDELTFNNDLCTDLTEKEIKMIESELERDLSKFNVSGFNFIGVSKQRDIIYEAVFDLQSFQAYLQTMKETPFKLERVKAYAVDNGIAYLVKCYNTGDTFTNIIDNLEHDNLLISETMPLELLLNTGWKTQIKNHR